MSNTAINKPGLWPPAIEFEFQIKVRISRSKAKSPKEYRIIKHYFLNNCVRIA